MLAIAPAEVGGTAVRKEEVRVLRAARTGVRRAARRREARGARAEVPGAEAGETEDGDRGRGPRASKIGLIVGKVITT